MKQVDRRGAARPARQQKQGYLHQDLKGKYTSEDIISIA